jgi:hypothetical protein
LKENIALAVAILAILAAFMYVDTGEGYRVYDCGMAEWHPDIPPKVKEECRRRALELWRENQNKTVI